MGGGIGCEEEFFDVLGGRRFSQRTLPVIRRIAYEILCRETEQKEKVLRISEKSVKQYLQEPESSLAILAGTCLGTEYEAYETAI